MNKKLTSLILIVAVVLSMDCAGRVFAESIDNTGFAAPRQEMFEPILQQIYNDYGELYEFENFEFKTFNFTKDDEDYIGIDVLVDMTLTRHPKDSPYFKGVAEAIKAYEDNDYLRSSLEKEIYEEIKDVESECYLVPDRTTFTYAYKAADSNYRCLKCNYSLEDCYYRVDGEETELIPADELNQVEDESALFEEGYESLMNSARELLLDKYKAASPNKIDVSYDRIAARDWARKNAFAEQEYPSKEVSGTDCANFVSKALRAGGIPKDEPGEWYGSKHWGGWAGKNWLRTGNKTKGGVVPYMTKKGYFSLVKKESKVNAGCIMYWTKVSHVALVTYGDGSTIKYTQHGAHQSKDTVYRSGGSISAKFYKHK